MFFLCFHFQISYHLCDKNFVRPIQWSHDEAITTANTPNACPQGFHPSSACSFANCPCSPAPACQGNCLRQPSSIIGSKKARWCGTRSTINSATKDLCGCREERKSAISHRAKVALESSKSSKSSKSVTP